MLAYNKRKKEKGEEGELSELGRKIDAGVSLNQNLRAK